MPTFERSREFDRLYDALSTEERRAFKRAVEKFIADMKRDGEFRKSLRVKGLRGAPGMYEMTWAMPDGRAVFSYGEAVREGEPHVIWHAVGGHEIFP